MSWADHVNAVVTAVGNDEPIPACPCCEEIAARLVVAGDPIRIEGLDGE